MKYVLRKVVLGNDPQITISKEQYQALKNSRNVLVDALAIEENFEILISNYLEFERQILSTSVEYMVRDHVDYSDLFEVRLALDIRLVNLLTSARLYVDQLCRHLRGDMKNTIKTLFSVEYDAHMEYRFMDALRNHVQHFGLPVHWTSSSSRWTSMDAYGLLEYSMDLAAETGRLAEDGRFKQALLKELPDKVDLKAAARCYLESFGRIHAATRQLIQESVNQARRTLEDAHARYGERYEGSLVGLSATKWDDQRCLETVPLLLEWDDIRMKLQRRNRSLVNLRKRYVSSKVGIGAKVKRRKSGLEPVK